MTVWYVRSISATNCVINIVNHVIKIYQAHHLTHHISCFESRYNSLIDLQEVIHLPPTCVILWQKIKWDVTLSSTPPSWPLFTIHRGSMPWTCRLARCLYQVYRWWQTCQKSWIRLGLKSLHYNFYTWILLCFRHNSAPSIWHKSLATFTAPVTPEFLWVIHYILRFDLSWIFSSVMQRECKFDLGCPNSLPMKVQFMNVNSLFASTNLSLSVWKSTFGILWYAIGSDADIAVIITRNPLVSIFIVALLCLLCRACFRFFEKPCTKRVNAIIFLPLYYYYMTL